MASQNIFHVWSLEFGSLAASLAQFATMFVLMVHFDGKQTFDSSLMSLNTITSILSTGSRASLLTTVSSCISQRNWAAFSAEPRRLYDFEMISESGRGPLGSLQLLINSRFKGGALLRFGAFLTLLSIAAGPFAQQLVRVRQTNFLQDGGSIAQGLPYSKGIIETVVFQAVSGPGPTIGSDSTNVQVVGVVFKPDFNMKASLTFALSADKKDVIRQAAFECPGTGCSFENFTSLAICSRCYDISSMLRVEQRLENISSSFDTEYYTVTEYSLPNGLYLENEDALPTLDWEPNRWFLSLYGSSNPNKSTKAGEIDTLIWAQSILRVDNSTNHWQWPNRSVYAEECVLYYCVKNYSFQVVNNSMELKFENELKEYQKHPNSWKPTGRFKNNMPAIALNSLAFHPNQSFFDKTDFQLSNDFSKLGGFNVSHSGINSISSFVQTSFSSCLGVKGCPAAVDDWKPPTGHYGKIRGGSQLSFYDPDLAPVMWSSKNLTARFDTIAASMSNSLRSGDDSNSRFVGKVTNPITVYEIHWPWIFYHLFLQVAAMAFFAITIIFNRNPDGRDIPVWKSSELAVMSQGSLVSEVFKGAETLKPLETVAKKTSIVLLARDEDQPLIQAGAVAVTDGASPRRTSASN
ncbi:unnamed protein product [Clonostachys rosea]|uniref:Uncharacterized protein n=1 Tax=Bionectria ochroleuca TaxID=29856 RepID=A0ABY6TSL8_BIOOC|nr:unnamed protein product [Clonostachys rosea]